MTFEAEDPANLAGFWGRLLGRVTDAENLLPGTDGQLSLRFAARTRAPGDGLNRMHLHLSNADQQETVERALGLGARHLDVGQRPEEGHIVLADPEGNEFCVIEAGNNFLANTAFLGELASDGTQAVGYFWSKALDWPLVWDQDEETAIQAPAGGPKIAWGGPPVSPKAPKNRMHFDLVVPADSDVDAEVERLVALGATRLESGQDGPDAIPMADPDGNEFCILTTPRR